VRRCYQGDAEEREVFADVFADVGGHRRGVLLGEELDEVVAEGQDEHLVALLLDADLLVYHAG